MMRDKNLFITVNVSFFLFCFLVFLVYLVYCFVFYDRNLEELYIDKFNDERYSFVYEHLDRDDMSFEEFMIPINLMYDKSNLISIYNKYYIYSNMSLDEFIDSYYYGNRMIDNENICLVKKGKTSLFKRVDLRYKRIEVFNRGGKTSVIGYVDDIVLEINNSSSVEVDGNELECINNLCKIEYIFGGLHEIKYINNGIEYYGLINISVDNSSIDVNLLDNLVKVE